MIEIYIIRCRVNGKIYIGQTKRGIAVRWQQHVAASKSEWKRQYSAISQAIAKHGPESFNISVLIGGIKTPEEANEVEIRMIAQCRATESRFGYNLHPGGSYTHKGDTKHKGKWGELVKNKIKEPKSKPQKPWWLPVPRASNPDVMAAERRRAEEIAERQKALLVEQAAVAERCRITAEEKIRADIEGAVIADETRAEFPIGCTVQEVGFHPKLGVVEGYAWGGTAIYGFIALSCLKVKWSGNKTSSNQHKSYVMRVFEISEAAA